MSAKKNAPVVVPPVEDITDAPVVAKSKKSSKKKYTYKDGTTGDTKYKNGKDTRGSDVIAKMRAKTKFAKHENPSTVHRVLDGSVRTRWGGIHPIVGVMRFLGNRGFSVAETREVVNRLGFQAVSDTCVKCQVASGRAGAKNPDKYKFGAGGFHGWLPTLSKDESKFLLSLRPVVVAE